MAALAIFMSAIGSAATYQLIWCGNYTFNNILTLVITLPVAAVIDFAIFHYTLSALNLERMIISQEGVLFEGRWKSTFFSWVEFGDPGMPDRDAKRPGQRWIKSGHFVFPRGLYGIYEESPREIYEAIAHLRAQS
jgi:hypothetical protein